MNSPVLTPTQLAERWHLSRTKVYGLIKKGIIHVIPHTKVIPIKWVEEQEQGPWPNATKPGLSNTATSGASDSETPTESSDDDDSNLQPVPSFTNEPGGPRLIWNTDSKNKPDPKIQP